MGRLREPAGCRGWRGLSLPPISKRRLDRRRQEPALDSHQNYLRRTAEKARGALKLLEARRGEAGGGMPRWPPKHGQARPSQALTSAATGTGGSWLCSRGKGKGFFFNPLQAPCSQPARRESPDGEGPSPSLPRRQAGSPPRDSKKRTPAAPPPPAINFSHARRCGHPPQNAAAKPSNKLPAAQSKQG